MLSAPQIIRRDNTVQRQFVHSLSGKETKTEAKWKYQCKNKKQNIMKMFSQTFCLIKNND